MWRGMKSPPIAKMEYAEVELRKEVNWTTIKIPSKSFMIAPTKLFIPSSSYMEAWTRRCPKKK